MDEISGSNHGESLVADSVTLYIPSGECPLCYDLGNENVEVEYRNVCDDCKFLLMEDLDSSEVCTMGTRYSSYDSVQSILSQQFSQMNSRARGSLFSDNESDAFEPSYWESDSDASRNSESFVRSSDESDIEESVADMDPMNVGPVLWISDNEFEGEGEGEDGSHWEYVDINGNLLEPSRSRSELHLLSRFDGRNIHMNWSRHDLAQGTFRLRIIGSFNYNQTFEDGAESEISSKGTAASASYISGLQGRIINENNMENTACAICKDFFTVGTYVYQLPCFHIYHPYCILPWLSSRNTCPLCRHELPTEQEYVKNTETNTQIEAMNELEMSDHISYIAAERNAEGYRAHIRRNRFMFTAAPVIGFLGISLMLLLGGNPFPNRRCRIRNLSMQRDKRGIESYCGFVFPTW